MLYCIFTLDLMFHTSAGVDTQEELCFWLVVVHCGLFEISLGFENP